MTLYHVIILAVAVLAIWAIGYKLRRKNTQRIRAAGVTTRNAQFLSAVSNALHEDGYVVVYISYAGGAGGQDYFLVRSRLEWEEILTRVNPWDRVSVFTREAIPIKGDADADLREKALTLLSRLHAEDTEESILAVKADSSRAPLAWPEDWSQLCSAEEVKTWFARHQNAPILIFPPPWINDKVLEAIG